ncbi:MAG: hypothetical protein HY321_03515 [Armatimonadetes bacterium]|nr:hypothetical protein [Armatimonadota bacterium]
MAEEAPVPCRLWVLPARAASAEVIFRRGPSKWVELIRWDTCADAFEEGQWFHGRIYEHRCDVSPDGSLLVYFASKFSKKTLKDPEYTYAWMAISRPPWLTALALWPKGDCWHGGGLFFDAHKVWLNHHPDKAVPHPHHRPHGLRVIPNPDAHGEGFPVLDRRMRHAGWTTVQDLDCEWRGGRWVVDAPEIRRKARPGGSFVLEMRLVAMDFAVPGGPWVFRFAIRDAASHGETLLSGATWADWDQQGRLVYAVGGRLFAAEVSPDVGIVAHELADFNACRPERREAPEWARHW